MRLVNGEKIYSKFEATKKIRKDHGIGYLHLDIARDNERLSEEEEAAIIAECIWLIRNNKNEIEDRNDYETLACQKTDNIPYRL